MRESITFYDFLLLPAYLLLFYFIILRYKKRNFGDSLTGKIFLYSFHVKMFGTVAFIFLTVYVLKAGDSSMYYNEGLTMNSLFFKNISNFLYLFRPAVQYHDYKIFLGDPSYEGYLSSNANLMPMKWVSLLSIISFRNYSVICLFFSLFAFAGQWQLYKGLLYFYPKLPKQLAIACLFVPSLAFWGGGILKDTICLGCIGFLFKGVVNVFFKKQKITSNVILIVICSAILFITKVYIILVLVPSILVWLFFEFKKRISFAIEFFLIYPLVIIIIISAINYVKNIDEFSLDWFSEKVQNQQDNFANIATITEEGSYFSIGELEPTPLGVLKKAPVAINATLFRPYIWESKKLVMLFSALESFVLLLFSFWVILKVGIISIIKAFVARPLILMCLVFSLTFAFAVGMTTPNFGTLVRYKIQCMPFYIAMLFMLLDYKKQLAKKRELRSAQ